ncbi:hypothetical protein, partial [Pseudomonas sp. NFACC24-1]|uniref:hypothetical protein n=1 Tax=Pseudomonas sp. NFACC24-1 TaxID=1566189 RepID=UPI001C446023
NAVVRMQIYATEFHHGLLSKSLSSHLEFCATSVRWGGRPDDSQNYFYQNKSVPFHFLGEDSADYGGAAESVGG